MLDRTSTRHYLPFISIDILGLYILEGKRAMSSLSGAWTRAALEIVSNVINSQSEVIELAAKW